MRCGSGRGMTKREALDVLIRNAAENVSGVGQGLRPEVSTGKNAAVVEAIVKLWHDAYAYPVDEQSLRNLGLRVGLDREGLRTR